MTRSDHLSIAHTLITAVEHDLADYRTNGVIHQLLGNPVPPPPTSIATFKAIRQLVKSGAESTVEAAYWIGDRQVQIGDRVKVLARSYAVVLQALVKAGAADYATLGDITTYTSHEAAKILKRLVKVHPDLAPYIHLPGAKGCGGYSTTIVEKLPSK
jgi:hypothetical protein